MNDLKKEDGYILVVVIGILTILSLMAITFATLSRIETRATRNYTDSVKCEMVAKAGLEHALYVLRVDKFGDDDVAYNNDSGDENYDWSGDNSWPGNTVFPGSDYDNSGNGTNDSAWIYFPATTSSLDIRLPGNLRARYAVLITDDREARVNINVAGNQPGNEGTSTTEIDMSSVIEQAPGLDATDGDNIASDIISKRSTMPFGVLTEAEIVGIAGTSTAYTSRLEESFQAYTGAYEDRKETLTAFSADTIVCTPYTLGTSTATTMLNINALVNNEGAYTDTDTYDSNKKVEMIMDVLVAGGLTGLSGTSNYVERHQLALNIKDFIDSDSTVTQYNDGSSIYYGIERTPYINEVEAEVSNPVAGVFGKYIELFNPYDTSLPIANWTISFGATTIIIDGPEIGTQTYYVIADNAQAYETDFAYEGGTEADQYEPDVNNLTTTGETLTLRDSSGNIVQVINYGQADNTTNTRQLNDPRPTPLMDADGAIFVDASTPWRWSTSSETAGEENATFDLSFSDDGWDNTTWPSSFFVANSSFFNKGYMGFIHRGSQWSSFKVDNSDANQNVLHYITVTDPSMDGIDNDGDGFIDSLDTGTQTGDIDGKEYHIPGLINVNTASEEALKSLPVIGATTAVTDIANGSKPYDSIKDLLVSVTNITDTSATNNKWNREKRFRSISNLITTRSNVFTVYVTAQITDEAISNVFAEKRIVAIVDRSVDPIKVRYFRWMTE